MVESAGRRADKVSGVMACLAQVISYGLGSKPSLEECIYESEKLYGHQSAGDIPESDNIISFLLHFRQPEGN